MFLQLQERAFSCKAGLALLNIRKARLNVIEVINVGIAHDVAKYPESRSCVCLIDRFTKENIRLPAVRDSGFTGGSTKRFHF